jgi:nicotinamide-nucleotide amidase
MTVVHALELLRRVLLGLDAAEESEEAQADREDRD